MSGDAIFEIYRTKRGWHWKLVAPNGETVARGGEPFDSKANVKRSIHRVRQYATLGKISTRE